MKHILVATDGSEVAMRAIDLAGEMAARFDVPLTVGHVLHFSRPSDEFERMAEAEHIVEHVRRAAPPDFARVMSGSMADIFAGTRPGDDMVRLVTMMGEALVARGADRARDKGATKIDTRTVQGDAADGILDLIDESGADMVVLGHRGLGRIRRLVMGSVALKVTQQAPCTVVSVR